MLETLSEVIFDSIWLVIEDFIIALAEFDDSLSLSDLKIELDAW